MYILGIYTGHTATAALLKDGEIVACASEERFNNQKNYLGFPEQAIIWCLKYAGIKPKDLEAVALCGLYGAPIHSSDKTNKQITLLALVYNLIGLVRGIWRRIVYYVPVLRPIGRFFYMLSTSTLGRYTVNREKQFIANWLEIPIEKVKNYEHHTIHAATAYYASPYNQEKALVLTLDAEGDRLCSTVNIYDRTKRERVAATSREHSIGWIFLYLTQYLGMKPMEHEYKVMGLAPYAKENHAQTVYEKIKDIISLDPSNPLRFRAKFNTQDALYYLKKEMSGYRFDNIAGAFQKLFEDRVLEWVKAAIARTNLRTVIFAGGAFMNVKANGKVAMLPSLERCFFMPSSGDESLPIGACYLAYMEANQPSKHDILPIKAIYWGPEYNNGDIKAFLDKGQYTKKYTITHHSNIEKPVGQLLAEGQIVARLSGRMEFGARALGNRSIMANPTCPDVIMIINEQMKDRDFWMPFAPSILAERVNDYCVNPKNFVSPYMMIGFETTALARKELKAAIHPYDFTARPQAVLKDWNPSYYAILKEFERLTGIGGILNTSFNLHGYPIVKGPEEAMQAFEHSGLEYLVLENYLIRK